MDKQQIIFERLKGIKDYWVNTLEESLADNADLIWSDYPDEYKILSTKLEEKEAKDALRKVSDEVIRGVIHSILVMIDGGDEVADKFKVDLIDEDNGQSLKYDCALHEDFFGYLLENE
ncbi:hypothetical protein CSC2_49180 [Clostridium zeae]|uniref:Histidine kinase n=1 Tax=Clostridium zeae TaxID=2759022 RepID=A0ABQ1EI34_9CLOT|nr:histidine kinase [Clostridium zeae]GFZ34392.1 hypothetical protein CSC2_49180 [Clostridium zeae]